MQFSVGDRVVHPYHGAGQITGLERKELLDEVKRYFVIDIPSRDLTVWIPQSKMEQVGIRPAVLRARFDRIMDTLQSQPQPLPEDYRDRQEEVWKKLKTGRTIQVAEVVRDLTWHRELAHLTKKDQEYLNRGLEMLSAEMALVGGTDVADVEKRIDTVLMAAVARLQIEGESQALVH
jgi:CarD family transcriptional regulator